MDYNTTQLNPETTFERHVFHRDQFGHFLRWTHVLKIAKIGMNVLDFGSGSGNLAEVLYRNRFKANKYLGLEYRQQTVNKANEKFSNVDWITFKQADLTQPNNYGNDWDIIASFEVIEHVNKKNGDAFLKNIQTCCNKDTIVLLSTPNYDEKVGAANNHIIDGIVQEYEYDELKELLQKYFIIEAEYGIFASQKDYKEWILNSEFADVYKKAHEYFDSNILSNLMAPLIPAKMARNIMWRLRLK